MLEALICKCCGGHIDRKTLKCSFCGAEHRIVDESNRVVIQTVERPCDVLCAQISVDRRELMFHSGDQRFSEYIVRELAHGLADELVKYMEIEKRVECDPLSDSSVFRARCRVLHPGYKF